MLGLSLARLSTTTLTTVPVANAEARTMLNFSGAPIDG
jgi:hypothetical protein